MKIFKTLTAGLLLLVATTANSSTTFSATDGDVNFLFSPIVGYDLYMFDNDNIGFEADALLAGKALFIDVPEIVGIAGPNGSGDYIATNESAQSIFLTTAPDFFISIYDGSTWIQDSNIITYGANSYGVEFNTAGGVILVDVEISAVPVPAAAWLFGSGLIGLVGVARRRA